MGHGRHRPPHGPRPRPPRALPPAPHRRGRRDHRPGEAGSGHSQAPRGALLLSRSAAQDLYWFGRYSGRGESTARLAFVAQDLVEDSSEHPGTDGFFAMSVLLDAIDAVTAVRGEEAGRSLATREGAGPTAPREHLRALVLDAGRRVERAQETLRILRAVAADPRADGAFAVIEAVARSRNSVISLRRRLAEDPVGLSGLEVGLDLLLSDPSNPRSVLFQLERLREDLAHMPSLSLDGAIGVPLDALTLLDVGRAAADREHLLAALTGLEEGVRAVSAVLDLGAPVPAAHELPPDGPTGPDAPGPGRVPGEDDPLLIATWALPSHPARPTRAVRSWAADLLVPDAPLGTALSGLVTRIHDGFEYRNGATNVWTSQDELLGIGAGVCQDFVHLAIAAPRGVGVPARSVSGYLETSPPPGKQKLEGSDATHAWLSVLLPDGRWLDLDPTNDCLADGRYVVSGWGRDYRDVAPLKGIIETEGTTSSLTVGVDVIRLD